MRAFGTILVAMSALAVLSTPALAADLTLKGLKGEVRTLSDADLKAMPHVKATLDNEGAPVVFEGVKVGALLSLVGATGEQLRGPALATVMIFTASDGYVVVLPLADMDVDFSAIGVVVADSKAGQPLDAREGPFRLMVEGDKRPARSARNLVGIELRNLR